MNSPGFCLIGLLLSPLWCPGQNLLFEPCGLPASQACKSAVGSLGFQALMMQGYAGGSAPQLPGLPLTGYSGYGNTGLIGLKYFPELVPVKASNKGYPVDISLCLEPAPGIAIPLPPGCRSLPTDACALMVSHDEEVVDRKRPPLLLPYPCPLWPPKAEADTDRYPQPCDIESCLTWENGSQKVTFDFSQTSVPDGFLRLDWARYLNHHTWDVYQTTDQQGQVIFYWYDSQGNRHSISQQEYWLILSRFFESWLHRLYPELFGPPLPARGGRHIWGYIRKSKPAGRQASGRGRGKKKQPPAGGTEGKSGREAVSSGAGQRPVAYVRPPPRVDGAIGGHSKPVAAQGTGAVETIASLMEEFEQGELKQLAKKIGRAYDGKKHSIFCTRIRKATQGRKLRLEDKKQLQPFIIHLTEVVKSSQFDARSTSTCVHSLTSIQLLYPLRQAKDRDLIRAINALTEALLSNVAQLGEFGNQAVANLLWALAKLVENGLQLDRGGLANGAVTALLPQVVQVASHQAGFIPQHIANLLWALAKLVENGLLKLDQGDLANGAVTALLLQVVQVAQLESHQARFTPQGVANLLWALAKLVENRLLKLDQGDLANGAVTALLPQVVQVAQLESHQARFTPQGVANLLWALAKLVENRLLKLDQGGLAYGALTALLPQVVQVAQLESHQAGFKLQEIAILLWALAKLVENGLLQLDQGDLANGALTALLPQVVQVAQVASHQAGFKPQEIANLLWALAKLVENGQLQLDQGGLANRTLTALLPQVVQVAQVESHQAGFIPQHIANLLWALAKLVENGLLKLDQGDLAKGAVMALLPQVVQVESRQAGFTPQGVANLLWALAKLVENGLLQLDQGGLANGALTALLQQVVQVASHQAGFTPQGVANLLWALAKLVENGLLKLDQGGLSNEALTALLPQVVQVESHQAGFKPQEIAYLLWALAKLVENGLLQLDQDGLANEAVTALLPQVVQVAQGESHRAGFIPQHIANLLWALAKLMENGQLQLDRGGLANEAVTALLPQVVQVASHQAGFIPQHIANLLWALAKLVENGLLNLDQGDLANGAVTALLLQVVQVAQVESHQAGFTPQGVANLLWALAKLVGNGLLKLDQGGLANEAVTALLPQVVQESHQAGFTPQGVASLLWALAKLMENGLLQLDRGGLANRAVTALLPQVVQESHQAGFTPQGVANLLWALAKLVENGLLKLDQGGLANEAVTALLPQVVQESHQARFTPQGVANLLWALAKLVENGLLQLDQGGLANEALKALLPQVVQVASHEAGFKPQEIANLLWALAKLVENGLLQLDQGGLANGAVTALLPQVASHQAGFKPQEIANLLWALAKLVENGLLKLDQGGLPNRAVTALLPQVVQVASHQAGFTPQGVANLLWALAKLVENGLLQLDQGGLTNEAVTALLPQVAQVESHQAGFTPQGVANLLWAIAFLGEGIELQIIEKILHTLSLSGSYSTDVQTQLLWSFMVFMARNISMNDRLKSLMKSWYDALAKQKMDEQLATMLSMAALWLELEANVNPEYKTRTSCLQDTFKQRLIRRYPNLEVHAEHSRNRLPPVDLYLPGLGLAIEIQGPHHYISDQSLKKTGRTILKVETYKKAGIEVIEVSYKDIDSEHLAWVWWILSEKIN